MGKLRALLLLGSVALPSFAYAQLPPAASTPLTGTESIQCYQSGAPKTCTSNEISTQAIGTINGILKANGAGVVSRAVPSTDYAPATSGAALLYGNAGGFSNATIGTGLSFTGGALSNTVTSSGTAIQYGNGAGGFSAVTIGTGLAFSGGTLSNTLSTTGSSLLYGNGAGGVSNVTIGSGISFSGGTLSASGAGGTVTVTGTPSSGQITEFSGASSITNGNLSGDCTTSVGLAVTCTKTSGTAFGTLATLGVGTGLQSTGGNLALAAGAAAANLGAGSVTATMLASGAAVSNIGFTPANTTNTVTAGSGLTGGGQIGSNPTLSIPSAGVTAAMLASGAAVSNIGYTPANIASPTFTGTPAAPTATAGTNTTQLATTAFVATSYAPLASPALTGTPTVPTAAYGTNTTQAASTAFVQANSGHVFAWATVIGNNTVGNETIAKSSNVATVYRSATGTYTVTFTTAAPDANYAVLCTLQSSVSAGGSVYICGVENGSTVQTYDFTLSTTNQTGSAFDAGLLFIEVLD